MLQKIPQEIPLHKADCEVNDVKIQNSVEIQDDGGVGERRNEEPIKDYKEMK